MTTIRDALYLAIAAAALLFPIHAYVLFMVVRKRPFRNRVSIGALVAATLASLATMLLALEFMPPTT